VELAGPYLQFYAYSLLAQPIGADMDKTNTSGVTSMLTTQSQALAALATLGFKVAQPWKLCSSREQVLATCREWNAHRGKWEYDADGAVVKVDEVAVQEALGSTGRYPRWAMAFKYADDTASTTLKGIEVTVGRTGVLTPVGKRQSNFYVLI
jgi:NAD-dependent DNA ligase